jgi:hypothetical protein
MPASSTPAHGRAVGEPRSLLAESRGQGCPRDRGREGLFLWLLSFRKKVTGRQGRRSNSHGREPVFAKRPDNTKDKVKMDSGFRRNDGEEVFAGMTKAEPRGNKRKNATRSAKKKPGFRRAFS